MSNILASMAGATRTGARVARIVADTGVVGATMRYLGEAVGRGRDDCNQVGALGGGHVVDAQFGLGVEHTGHDRAVGNRGEGERREELERGVGHQDVHSRVQLDEFAGEVNRLVAGDGAGYAQRDVLAFE